MDKENPFNAAREKRKLFKMNILAKDIKLAEFADSIITWQFIFLQLASFEWN